MEEQGMIMAIPALQMPVGIFISQGVLIQLPELPQQVLTKLHLEDVYDAFLVKFNSSGVRQWGTYYGGTGNDMAYSCATDASGNIYLSGYTTSTSWNCHNRRSPRLH